ncbi:MAG: LuxR family transcriptional regulator [Gammaproteobacteria bacterium]|nr:MAG: LuxR family transcriptional regulator [Gammaproteobacteria bacterium]
MNTRLKRLTKKEHEVLHWLKRGHSNKEIGEKLKRSPCTIKNHISSILQKLEAKDRRQAIIKLMDSARD